MKFELTDREPGGAARHAGRRSLSAKGKLKRRVEQVEESIGRCPNARVGADVQEGEIGQVKAGRLKDKIASMKSNCCAPASRRRSPSL